MILRKQSAFILLIGGLSFVFITSWIPEQIRIKLGNLAACWLPSLIQREGDAFKIGFVVNDPCYSCSGCSQTRSDDRLARAAGFDVDPGCSTSWERA